MAKDIDRVCEKYEVRLGLGRVPGRKDGNRELQLAAFRQAQENDQAVRKLVSKVISAEGISTIWWVYFYAFGRKLAWLMSHRGSTEVLHDEARMQLEVWAARGLPRPVLEKVAWECFELDLTGPIPTLAQTPERT